MILKLASSVALWKHSCVPSAELRLPPRCYLASEILIFAGRGNPMNTDTSGEVWNRGGHRDFCLVDSLGPGVELNAVKMHKKAHGCRFAWCVRIHPDLCWLGGSWGNNVPEIYWLIGPQTTSLSGINIHCCLYQNYLTNVCRHLNQANVLESYKQTFVMEWKRKLRSFMLALKPPSPCSLILWPWFSTISFSNMWPALK